MHRKPKQRFFLSLFALILSSPLLVLSQTQTSSPDAEARANSLLKKLTLEEKVDLIGGVDDFYIRSSEKIGLPRLKMADGPVGVRNYGLSYTTFSYQNLKISSPSSDQNQQVSVTFDVTNTGVRAGADVAEVYVVDRHAPVLRPVKELKGFAKVNLNPGEIKTMTVKLDRRAFSYYDVAKHDWTVAPGEFDLLVGRSAADIELAGKVTVH
jgi:hypothetical protein